MGRSKKAGESTVTFTAKRISSLAGPDKEHKADPREWSDLSTVGLRLKVRRSGARSFCVRYRTKALRLRVYSLGSTKQVSLKQAREKATEIVALARLGGDPQADVVKGRRASDFAALVERFIEAESPRWRPSTQVAWEWALRKRVIPELGKLKVPDVTRAAIREFVEAQVKRAPTGGLRTFEVIRRIFSWAEAKELVLVSPCRGLTKESLGGVERKRDRVYTDDELRRLMGALRKIEKGDRDLSDLFMVAAATGTRSLETRSMRWADVDLDTMTWTIPGEVSKNEEAHVVPLVGLAKDVIERRHKALRSAKVVKIRRATPVFVFSSRNTAGYIGAPRRGIGRLRRQSGIADLRLHDVRRTVRTKLAELGVSDLVGEKILGHVLPGVLGIYNRHSYSSEVRAALTLWAERLDRITTGKAGAAQK